MTHKERTIAYLNGEKTDEIPFHPLVMQYAASKTGLPFGKYCQDPIAQCGCMLEFSKKFGMGCTHPSGYPYCEAMEYGLEVTYPENSLPIAKEHLIKDFERDIHFVRPLDIEKSEPMMKRITCVKEYVKRAGDEVFICGHAEGPLAEYCDLRGAEDGLLDLYDYPEEMKTVLQIITDNTKKWIDMQVEAGCHCMSIGDAIASQISEEMYVEFVLPLHKQLAEYIARKGVYSKFHICGDTSRIIPHLAKIGVNIIDVDHLVKNIEDFIPLLGEKQVLCGNIDPVSMIKNGTPEQIDIAVKELVSKTRGKCFVSAGCEIPLGTPEENFKAFAESAKKYV